MSKEVKSSATKDDSPLPVLADKTWEVTCFIAFPMSSHYMPVPLTGKTLSECWLYHPIAPLKQ